MMFRPTFKAPSNKNIIRTCHTDRSLLYLDFLLGKSSQSDHVIDVDAKSENISQEKPIMPVNRGNINTFESHKMFDTNNRGTTNEFDDYSMIVTDDDLLLLDAFEASNKPRNDFKPPEITTIARAETKSIPSPIIVEKQSLDISDSKPASRKKKRTETPSTPTIRQPASSSSLSSWILHDNDFSGLELFITNAASSLSSLQQLIHDCKLHPHIAISFIFSDLTSNHSPLTRKFCTPKSSCDCWNCCCDRHVRASQSFAGLLAVLVYLPVVDGGKQEHDNNNNDDDDDDDDDNQSSSSSGNHFYILPLSNSLSSCSSFEQAVSDTTIMTTLSSILTDDDVKKIIFNAQVALLPFMRWFYQSIAVGGELNGGCGVSLSSSSVGGVPDVMGIIDPKVACWMRETDINEDMLELNELESKWLLHNSSSEISRAEAILTSKVLDVNNLGKCAKIIFQIAKELIQITEIAIRICVLLDSEGSFESFEKTEMALIPVLTMMEIFGVSVSTSRISELQSDAAGRLSLLEQAIIGESGEDINLSSPEQVSHLLFSVLKLPAPAMKPGQKHVSTSEDVLEELRLAHPVVSLVLDHRAIAKLKFGYIDALPTFVACVKEDDDVLKKLSIDPVSTRIHSQWNQTSVRTGRLSSCKPAVQTIPRSEDTDDNTCNINIRKVFIASGRDRLLVSADYSQIEMRILAHCCRDVNMIRIFDNSGDIYKQMASMTFRKPIESVTKIDRNQAKVLALGIVYGMGALQVSKRLSIQLNQAQALVRDFFRAFPGIEQFISKSKQFGHSHGYVTTISGRRRSVSGINDASDSQKRAQAERQAVNSVIQGSASDIIKMAMILLFHELNQWRSEFSLDQVNSSPIMILQIHDELVFDCPSDSASVTRLVKMIRRCMETETKSRFGLAIPLKVNVSMGVDWGSLQSYEDDVVVELNQDHGD